MESDAMLRVPVNAEYQMVDGNPVLVKEEYADVPVSAFVDLLVRAYGPPSEWKYPED